MFLFLRSLILDAADWCARCYRRLTQHGRAEAIANHPAARPRAPPPSALTDAETTPTRTRQRRALLVDRAGWRYPARGLHRHRTSATAIGALPTYSKEHAVSAADTSIATGLHLGLDEQTYHADPGSLSVSGAKTLLKAPGAVQVAAGPPGPQGRLRLRHPRRTRWSSGSASRSRSWTSWTGAPRLHERRATRCAIRGAAPLLMARTAARSSEWPTALLPHPRHAAASQGAPRCQRSARTGVPASCAAAASTGSAHAGSPTTRPPRPWTRATSPASGAPCQVGLCPAGGLVHRHRPRPGATRRLVRLHLPDEGAALPRDRRIVPDAELHDARARNREALERFRDCTESGIWPGYLRDDAYAVLSLTDQTYSTEETA